MRELIFDPGDIVKSQKIIVTEHKGRVFEVWIGVNPWSGKLHVTIKQDKKIMAQNKLVVVGEYILDAFSFDREDYDWVECDFIFKKYDDNETEGFLVRYDELNTKVGLYIVEKGELDED